MRGLALIIFILSCLHSSGQNADAIRGKWIKMPKKDLIIEVYKYENYYNGVITWSKDPSKPRGFVIVDHLTFNTHSKKWVDGKIHDPGSTRTYSSEVKLDDSGNLVVMGYMGMKFFSKSRTFARME